MTRVARTLRGTPRNLARLARALQAGELVAVPTETVYGLAANALSATACRRIFRAKRRPTTDPLIVHLASADELATIAEPNDAALALARAFWPGPLTLVLPRLPRVPDVVTSGRGSVAVRVPAHPLFRALLRRAALPLAAPSANPFGYVSPTTAAHVRDGLGARIPYILDGGPATIGVESTIVDVRDPKRPRLLRPGAVTRAQIEAVLGARVSLPPRKRARAAAQAQLAPGMLTRHYSPRTPVALARTTAAWAPNRTPQEAFVYLRRPAGRAAANVHWLDPKGDLRGVARRLFATLRALDTQGYARIHVELASGDGLAEAINDRLQRAAAKA